VQVSAIFIPMPEPYRWVRLSPKLQNFYEIIGTCGILWARDGVLIAYTDAERLR
jgi:hypothetical protein